MDYQEEQSIKKALLNKKEALKASFPEPFRKAKEAKEKKEKEKK